MHYIKYKEILYYLDDVMEKFNLPVAKKSKRNTKQHNYQNV